MEMTPQQVNQTIMIELIKDLDGEKNRLRDIVSKFWSLNEIGISIISYDILFNCNVYITRLETITLTNAWQTMRIDARSGQIWIMDRKKEMEFWITYEKGKISDELHDWIYIFPFTYREKMDFPEEYTEKEIKDEGGLW
jgi:hypothetical protein